MFPIFPFLHLWYWSLSNYTIILKILMLPLMLHLLWRVLWRPSLDNWEEESSVVLWEKV